MKKLLLSFILLALPFIANAEKVQIDGIWYELNSETASAEVTSSEKLSGYAGDIVIPQNITYDGIKYSVTSIGIYAFYGCEYVTNIIIPDGVTSIGWYAFVQCTSLTNIDIPNSVEVIGGLAFYGCVSLTNLFIPNSVTRIGDSAFKNCTSLTNVAFSNSMNVIDMDMFRGCTNLTSIIFPNSVKEIAGSAFRECSSLANITIPNSVTNIGSYAFCGCTGLTSITIGNSVTSIGNNAFYDCTALTELKIAATTPPTVDPNNFDNSNYINMTIKVPEGSLAAYQAADVWKNFWNIQEDAALDIKNAVLDTEDTTAPIYNFQGVRMKESKEHLPAGIYIQGGKKMIVR